MKQIGFIFLSVLLLSSCNYKNTNNTSNKTVTDSEESVSTMTYQKIGGKTNNDKYDWFRQDSMLVDSTWAELMPYQRIFVSENFLSAISNKNIVFTDWLKNALGNREGELLLFSIFVGGATRTLVPNEYYMSSDMSTTNHVISPQFFTYSFGYYTNMFVNTVPAIPNEIKQFRFSSDTLLLELKNDVSNTAYVNELTLVPIDKRNALKNSKGSVWILNGSQRMVDITYLKDNMKTDLYFINHQYFYEILERLVQEKRGERPKLYFEEFLDSILQEDNPIN